MKITIDMPAVAECRVAECAYNLSNACHARAITIGDGVHPGCDTFLASSRHSSDRWRTAGVGACKVTGCKFNEDFECVAEAISVGHQGGTIDCLTFAKR